MQGKEQDFYEIYDYYTQPILEQKYVQITLFSILTIITVGLIFLFFWIRSCKRIKTYWDLALQDLYSLKPEKCSSKKDFKSFYFTITSIFKKYLDKRYAWHTETKTDEELIKYLESESFDATLLMQIQKILEGAVWVKFANQDALKNQAESDLKIIIKIVEQTKPAEPK
jgi:hypothetical protein